MKNKNIKIYLFKFIKLNKINNLIWKIIIKYSFLNILKTNTI